MSDSAILLISCIINDRMFMIIMDINSCRFNISDEIFKEIRNDGVRKGIFFVGN